MKSKLKAALLAVAVAFAVAVPVGTAVAGDCTGYVVGVRPMSQYNHARGTGFLAVRSGPGSRYQQIGELYANDEISVWGRRGNWYEVQCMQGSCVNPVWGDPSPHGWVSGNYIDIGGVCP